VVGKILTCKNAAFNILATAGVVSSDGGMADEDEHAIFRYAECCNTDRSPNARRFSETFLRADPTPSISISWQDLAMRLSRALVLLALASRTAAIRPSSANDLSDLTQAALSGSVPGACPLHPIPVPLPPSLDANISAAVAALKEKVKVSKPDPLMLDALNHLGSSDFTMPSLWRLTGQCKWDGLAPRCGLHALVRGRSAIVRGVGPGR
jgi:hypothetical protein